MRRWVVLILVLFLLLACSKGKEVSGKNGLLEDIPENGEEPSEVSTEEGPEGTETNTSEDLLEGEKQELPEGVIPGTCVIDSKGVVRVYAEDGTKTVYRHDCTGGILIRYSCEDNKIKSKNVICSTGQCKQGPYGDSCV